MMDCQVFPCRTGNWHQDKASPPPPLPPPCTTSFNGGSRGTICYLVGLVETTPRDPCNELLVFWHMDLFFFTHDVGICPPPPPPPPLPPPLLLQRFLRFQSCCTTKILWPLCSQAVILLVSLSLSTRTDEKKEFFSLSFLRILFPFLLLLTQRFLTCWVLCTNFQ